MLRTLTMRRGLTMVRRAHSIKRVGLRTQFLKRTPKQFGGMLLFGPLLMSKDAPELQHHEIHKFTPTVKVQSMQEVHQNIFKRLYVFYPALFPFNSLNFFIFSVIISFVYVLEQLVLLLLVQH